MTDTITALVKIFLVDVFLLIIARLAGIDALVLPLAAGAWIIGAIALILGWPLIVDEWRNR